MAPAARFFIPESISDEFCPLLITPPPPSQFFGRKNAGMIAQGGTGPTGVHLASYIEERAHAKNVGDGLASEIKNKVTRYSKSGSAVKPGTRNQVLLLAELYPKPLRDAGNKSGVWSPDRIFYAYYSEEVLASNADLSPTQTQRGTTSASA